MAAFHRACTWPEKLDANARAQNLECSLRSDTKISSETFKCSNCRKPTICFEDIVQTVGSAGTVTSRFVKCSTCDQHVLGLYCPSCRATINAKLATPPVVERKGACFVATAAFQGAGHPTVDALRSWRDTRLARVALGRLCIALYERLGPVAAKWLVDHPRYRPAARRILTAIARSLA